MMEGTRDYPGTISPYELDIIHKVGPYKIAFEKGKKMYGPELAICNNYFLIIDKWAYRIDNRSCKRILESDFDEKIIKDERRKANDYYLNIFRLDE